MEELPRVDPNEDPYLALRTALAVAICHAHHRVSARRMGALA